MPSRSPTPDLVLGVDAGATSLRVALVAGEVSGELHLGGRRSLQDWTQLAGFEPAPLAQQLAEREHPQLSVLECAQATAWVETLATAVHELVGGLPRARLRLGVAAPGLKSADGRGIEVMANGPRIPGFLTDLERTLRGRQIELHLPLPALGSDGVDAGLGELHGQSGAFRDRERALLLHLGTGVAEAVLAGSRVLETEDAATLGPAPWAALTPEGATVEEAAGLGPAGQRLVQQRGPGLRLLDAARRGDERAWTVLLEGAAALAWHARARAEQLGGLELLLLGGHARTLFDEPSFSPWKEHLLRGLSPLSCEVRASALEFPALLGAGARALGLGAASH